MILFIKKLIIYFFKGYFPHSILIVRCSFKYFLIAVICWYYLYTVVEFMSI